MVPMQVHATVRARMPAERQALGDQDAAARTGLAGERWMDRYDSPTGACCLVGEGAQERCPPGILDAFGEVMVPEHVGRLQVLVIDRVVLPNQRQRCLVMEVCSLASHLLVRFGEQLDRLAPTVTSLLATGDPAL
jgi:hypothetical protein